MFVEACLQQLNLCYNLKTNKNLCLLVYVFDSSPCSMAVFVAALMMLPMDHDLFFI